MIRVFVDFALLLSAIGLIGSRHVVTQSKVITKPIFFSLAQVGASSFLFVLSYDRVIGLSGELYSSLPRVRILVLVYDAQLETSLIVIIYTILLNALLSIKKRKLK